MSNKLSKVPSLKVIDDAEAAAKIRELIKDADDGLRRILKCGLYIEWVSANLPHGQIMPWLQFHLPDVSYTTVCRWRTAAKNFAEWAGLKFSQWENLKTSPDQFLYTPIKQLPAPLQKAREKMETILDSAKSPKQLFLDMGFKQGELDAHGYPRSKVGRRKGEGGNSKEALEKHRLLTEKEKINARRAKCEEFAAWLKAESDDAHLGDPEVEGSEEFAAMVESINYFTGWQKAKAAGWQGGEA